MPNLRYDVTPKMIPFTAGVDVSLSFSEYSQTLHGALQHIEQAQLDNALVILEQAYHDEQAVFVIGNGQSATSANAFAVDLTRQTFTPSGKPRFRTISLAANAAALTALSNDISFEAVFKEQLISLYRPGDVLVAISASGNSPNILRACEWVRTQGGRVIALTGFNGGQLHRLADVSILVNIHDYGHVETAHLAVMHYWIDVLRGRIAEGT